MKRLHQEHLKLVGNLNYDQEIHTDREITSCNRVECQFCAKFKNCTYTDSLFQQIVFHKFQRLGRMEQELALRNGNQFPGEVYYPTPSDKAQTMRKGSRGIQMPRNPAASTVPRTAWSAPTAGSTNRSNQGSKTG